MEFVIDFLYVGDGDAIIIWGRKANEFDAVFFLDGGKAGDGEKVVKHYNTLIKPYLYEKNMVGFINSHPHADHINGLIEIVEALTTELKFAVYNDPVACITEEHREKIYQSYLKKEDNDISHLYETFEKIDKLNGLCATHNIKRYTAYSGTTLWDGAFKILSPSEDFYVNMVQHFSDIDFLKTVDFSQPSPKEVNELEEDTTPCKIVDEQNDASPENLTSTVIQLTDGKNRKCILTADAGVDSFDYMETEGFSPENITFVQLPHHGSRRNVNANWLKKFNPNYYIASAVGNQKHPRRAVINCIKRNLPNCNVYSTHTSKGVISHTTDKSVFPDRGWSPATPL